MTIKLFASAIAISFTMSSMFSSPAFAIGGNDPIPGIDIIIKKNPASRPLRPGSFGEKEIGLTYNAGAEKLEARLRELTAQTMKANGLDGNWRLEADASTMMSSDVWRMVGEVDDDDASVKENSDFRISSAMLNAIRDSSKDLSEQIVAGDTGRSSFSYPSADGKSKITVIFRIHGDGDAEPQAKSAGIGMVQGKLSASAHDFPSVSGLDAGTPKPAIKWNDMGAISNLPDTSADFRASVGCVTVEGDVDANCDGAEDKIEPAAIDRERTRPAPRQQRR